MNLILQVEAIAPFILSIVLINLLPLNFAWWEWILIFLVPDISMIGYAAGNMIGAIVYNVVHHQLVAVVVGLVGLALQLPYIELAGLVLLGHSSIDRAMGFGLKLDKGFKFTHLS